MAQHLPDIIASILSKLSLYDLLAARLASSKWKAISEQPRVLRVMAQNTIQLIASRPLTIDVGTAQRDAAGNLTEVSLLRVLVDAIDAGDDETTEKALLLCQGFYTEETIMEVLISRWSSHHEVVAPRLSALCQKTNGKTLLLKSFKLLSLIPEVGGATASSSLNVNQILQAIHHNTHPLPNRFPLPENFQFVHQFEAGSPSMRLADIPEFPRQLALYAFDLTRKVKICQLFQNSMKNLTCPLGTGLKDAITFYNHICVWVSNEILRQETIPQCARMFERMADVAMELYRLNDLSSCTAVLNGLQNHLVRRVIPMMEQVSPPAKIAVAYLATNVASNNALNLAMILDQAPTTYNIYLGALLTTIMFSNSTPPRVADNGLLSFQWPRLVRCVPVIELFERSVKKHMSFEVVPSIRSRIVSEISVPQPDVAEARSIALHPRQQAPPAPHP